jgi:hypothetical protein
MDEDKDHESDARDADCQEDEDGHLIPLPSAATQASLVKQLTRYSLYESSVVGIKKE